MDMVVMESFTPPPTSVTVTFTFTFTLAFHLVPEPREVFALLSTPYSTSLPYGETMAVQLPPSTDFAHPCCISPSPR